MSVFVTSQCTRPDQVVICMIFITISNYDQVITLKMQNNLKILLNNLCICVYKCFSRKVIPLSILEMTFEDNFFSSASLKYICIYASKH